MAPVQLAAELLAAPVAADVRRVEEPDALPDGSVERRARLVGRDRPTVGTELPGAQTTTLTQRPSRSILRCSIHSQCSQTDADRFTSTSKAARRKG